MCYNKTIKEKTLKVYIDLGSYIGETIQDAIKKFDDFDMFIGFEPIPELFKKCVKRFKGNPKVRIHRLGVSDKNEKLKLYLDYFVKEKRFGSGSSTLKSKKSGRVKKSIRISRCEKIKCIDFSEFIKEQFTKDDYIVIKMNVEGQEYDILEHMLAEDTVDFINVLYCSWHMNKMKNPQDFEDRQQNIIDSLEKHGFVKTSSTRLQDIFKSKTGTE